MSLLGSIAGALGGSALQALGSAATGLINSAIGRSNAKWTAALDWKYLQKAKALDWEYDSTKYFDLDKKYYEYQAAQQYALARRYAENSSKWQVQGLRNAGLNPILAATDGNFRGTFGDPVQMSRSGGHGSAGSIKSQKVDGSIDNLGSSMAQGFKTVIEGANTEANTKNQETQADLNIANAAKVQAETAEIQSRTQKNLIDASNSAKHGGYTSFGSQLLNNAKSVAGKLGSFISGITDRQDQETYNNQVEAASREAAMRSRGIQKFSGSDLDSSRPIGISKEAEARYRKRRKASTYHHGTR